MSKSSDKPCLSLVALLARHSTEELPAARDDMQRFGQQVDGACTMDQLQEGWFFPRSGSVGLKPRKPS